MTETRATGHAKQHIKTGMGIRSRFMPDLLRRVQVGAAHSLCIGVSLQFTQLYPSLQLAPSCSSCALVPPSPARGSHCRAGSRVRGVAIKRNQREESLVCVQSKHMGRLANSHLARDGRRGLGVLKGRQLCRHDRHLLLQRNLQYVSELCSKYFTQGQLSPQHKTQLSPCQGPALPVVAQGEAS